MSPTVGIEVEFDGIASEAANPVCTRYPGARVFDDRSSRGQVFLIDGVPIRPHKRQRGRGGDDNPDNNNAHFVVPSGVTRGQNIGLEIVSSPMDRDTAEDFASFCASLYGHVPQTERTSIHVHVDVGNKPWRYIQNLLKWCYVLEAPLYKLATRYQTHRGCRLRGNDYKYARPLSAPIALAFSKGGEYGSRGVVEPMINIEQVLNANSWTDLLAGWGRLDYVNATEMRGNHYLPHRLSGFNIHSIIRQGTFEWRLFDAVYEAMPEMLALVYKIHELAESPPPSNLKPMLVGDKPAISVDFIGDLLGAEQARVWAKTGPWPLAVHDRLRLHHYAERQNIVVPMLTHVSPITFEDKLGHSDNRSDAYVPYIRR